MAQYNNIKRIGVISDTHIPTRAPRLPVKIHDIFNGVNLIIHAGDIVSDGPILELGMIAPVAAVKGNMDYPELNLPDELTLNINDRFTLCVNHGTGSPSDICHRLYKKFYERNPYMIIFGHTHLAEDKVINGLRYLNPGSPTSGRGRDTVAVITFNEIELKTEFIEI
ncbi:MAG: YfcE family phosphodiesterase [Spirochaetia bacterium]|nr:YfcE family phosphodiesterase [Spirochaetia bacterium]